MNAVPMRPWQNALAIIATFLAAGALLPLGTRFRLTCAFAAAAIIFVLLAVRLRSHSASRKRASTTATFDRIARIRADRAKRFDRH